MLISLLRGERTISDAELHKKYDKELFDFDYKKENNEDVKPPLVIAAGANNVDVLNFILSKNGSVDIAAFGTVDADGNCLGITPLAAAAANCHIETVEILMKWGADAKRKVILGSRELTIKELVDKTDPQSDKLFELLEGGGKRKSGRK